MERSKIEVKFYRKISKIEVNFYVTLDINKKIYYTHKSKLCLQTMIDDCPGVVEEIWVWQLD